MRAWLVINWDFSIEELIVMCVRDSWLISKWPLGSFVLKYSNWLGVWTKLSLTTNSLMRHTHSLSHINPNPSCRLLPSLCWNLVASSNLLESTLFMNVLASSFWTFDFLSKIPRCEFQYMVVNMWVSICGYVGFNLWQWTCFDLWVCELEKLAK